MRHRGLRQRLWEALSAPSSLVNPRPLIGAQIIGICGSGREAYRDRTLGGGGTEGKEGTLEKG